MKTQYMIFPDIRYIEPYKLFKFVDIHLFAPFLPKNLQYFSKKWTTGRNRLFKGYLARHFLRGVSYVRHLHHFFFTVD